MPIVKWPNDDDNAEFSWGFFDTGRSDDITVFESEDDEELMQSSLVAPDGSPIHYHRPSTKLGYIGFIHPDYSDHLASQKKKRRRKKTK